MKIDFGARTVTVWILHVFSSFRTYTLIKWKTKMGLAKEIVHDTSLQKNIKFE